MYVCKYIYITCPSDSKKKWSILHVTKSRLEKFDQRELIEHIIRQPYKPIDPGSCLASKNNSAAVASCIYNQIFRSIFFKIEMDVFIVLSLYFSFKLITM